MQEKYCPPTAAAAMSPPLVMVSTFAPLMTGADAAASALIAVAVASAVNENSPAVKLSKDSLVVKMIS